MGFAAPNPTYAVDLGRRVDNGAALSTNGAGACQWKTLRGFPRYDSLGTGLLGFDEGAVSTQPMTAVGWVERSEAQPASSELDLHIPLRDAAAGQDVAFGFVFLGDHLTSAKVIAIVIATVGVVVTALRPGGQKSFADLRPTVLGLGAAAVFAISAVSFRGAIIAVPGVSFVTAASYTLMWSLFVQTLILSVYLLLRAPDVLRKILGLWRPSLFAGFMGAFSSQFWFLAFALTAAANVRTLALIEVLFAQGVAYFSLKQPFSLREVFGIVLIVIGVALLIAA